MNNIKLFITVVLVFSFTGIYSQDYSIALIPDSLKTNAHIIIRDDNQEMELRDINSGSEKIRKIITILDKEGENTASLVIPYDINSSVHIGKIIIFDSNGKKIKSVKQSDITDSPAYGSAELFSESRIKYYRPNSPVFPYTVLYEYDIDLKNIISLGCWRPFSTYNVSTQHSKLIFIYPTKIKINKKEINIKAIKSLLSTNTIVETWEINNLKAFEDEPFDISLTERIPCVYLMPSILSYDKYYGTADNWREYGKWIYSLYEGRDKLSDNEIPKVETLVQGIPDTLERIKMLYQYIQKNTRYVSITLGLGGFQPFDAKTVFETGYGDCKALTNYLYSLLKHFGIKSYPAIVSSGRYKEPIFTDFPNFQQFDHVILCVPYAHDTLWLECTNQKIPFGFLGDFTDDRDVLLISDKGGKFAHTKKYEANENLRSCRSEFNIDSTGTAICSIKTLYHGLQYDNISELFSSNYDEQKKWLYSNSTLPSLQIKSFSISDFRGIIPVARITESEISKNYCSFSGNYMVLSLNILNSQKAIQKMLKPRYSDILIERSSVDCDTLIYSIPRNYRYESAPPGINISSKFGSYSSSVSTIGKEIIYIRKFILLEGRYNASFYKELYDFILSVSKGDNLKMILTKKG